MSKGKRDEQEIPTGEITNDERTIPITMSIQPLVEKLEHAYQDHEIPEYYS